MDGAHIVALAIFVSYFLAIIALFALILSSLNDWKPWRGSRVKSRCTFGLLTLASLAHTWLHMFKFLAWSFNAYEASLEIPLTETSPALTRLTSWLLNTSLFEQAWAAVCFGPFNWWWSQQLCIYTVGAWTVFLATQGRNRGVPYIWAYMLLGQLVAISVASNLFYLALLTSAPSPSPEHEEGKSKSKTKRLISAFPTLHIPVVLSLGTIAYSPYTSVASGTFLPNLLLMHTLIVIPLVGDPFTVSFLPNMRLRGFAIYLSTISILLHAFTTFQAFYSLAPGLTSISELANLRSEFMASAWETLHAHHPAQSSIGWDVVWTTVSFMVWTLVGGWHEEGKPRRSIKDVFAALATPLLSVGAVAPWVFGGEPAQGVKEE